MNSLGGQPKGSSKSNATGSTSATVNTPPKNKIQVTKDLFKGIVKKGNKTLQAPRGEKSLEWR